MSFQHQGLALGKWEKLSFFEQMANIGSEVERTIAWKQKGDEKYSRAAFERALELMFLTIDDSKNKDRLKELCRVYEVLVDYFFGENLYGSSDQLWRNYFYNFNYAASLKAGR